MVQILFEGILKDDTLKKYFKDIEQTEVILTLKGFCKEILGKKEF